MPHDRCCGSDKRMTESEWQRKQADDTARQEHHDRTQEAARISDWEDRTGRDWHTNEYFDS